ncbi:MAG: AmmeMemoRadiSam system protein B [Kiritimatiellia bacterium]|jgi:hypothetical protein|nr:AmmeMemoRadiSam system protein B [Kiritimatiellia bacterium]MDP6630464.1 AmmeMemoRadiSam system protein B [Kiritimatiellia bacterium]MDP6809921.1 AmmeMemoRadiSam system protein B [Kiritimatiellia bacterium]MDP7024313.1 AmmeMemoRadiSam system protein B [Kiritimatiellia bacterium]
MRSRCHEAEQTGPIARLYQAGRTALLLGCAAGCTMTGTLHGGEEMKPNAETRVHTTLGDGRWFPGDPAGLRRQVNAYIDAADAGGVTGRIVSALAPHAGYVYSGAVAGHTFRTIRDTARAGLGPDLVVVLGFSHRSASPGVALLDADIIRSPMGDATVDTTAAAQMVKGRPRIVLDSRPHQGEHSAENEIPFVQAALPDSPMVVGIIGDHDPRTRHELLEALEELAKTRQVLVVASTDLLHDADYDKVSATDRRTLDRITALDSKGLAESWSYRNQVCCGIGPVLTAMAYARARGATRGTLLRYRNSGDDHPESRGNWVVGYGAVVFTAD